MSTYWLCRLSFFYKLFQLFVKHLCLLHVDKVSVGVSILFIMRFVCYFLKMLSIWRVSGMSVVRLSGSRAGV